MLKIRSFITKLFSLLLIFIISTSSLAYAHNAYYIQALINDATMNYVGIVTYDKASFFSNEDKHYEAQLGDFSSLVNYDKPSSFNLLAIRDKFKNGEQAESGSGSKPMPLTFPGIEDKTKGTNNATRADEERAYFVKDIIIPSLNSALLLINNNKNFTSIDELVNMTQKLFNGGTVNGYTIAYGTRASNPENRIVLPKGLKDSDVVTIYKTDANGKKIEYEFIYRVPKGYRDIGRGKDATPLVNSAKANYSQDAKYISWGTIAYEATYAYYAKGFLLRTASEQVKPGVIERELIDLFSNVVSMIRSLLGLYDVDELVFNQGTRSGSTFYGVMPKAWLEKVNIFYLIFQILAFLLIIFSIVKMLFEKNLSTINTAMRVNMINQIQKLFIAGLILSALFPLMTSVVFKLNYILVKVFNASSYGSIADAYKALSYQSGTLGGIIIQFAYLFVMLYLNFTYIVRSIIVSLLVASAPLFVVSMALNNNNRLFFNWIKELVGNVYLQSVHAFALSFFTTIGLSSRGIETLVVLFSLIPITNMFRQMIFGEAGNLAGMLGEAGVQGVVNSTMSAIGGLASGSAIKNIGDKFAKPDGIKIKDSSMYTKGDSYLTDDSGSIKVGDMGTMRDRINSTKEAISNKPLSLNNLKEEMQTRNNILNNLEEKEMNSGDSIFDRIRGQRGLIENIGQVATGIGIASAGVGAIVGTGNTKIGQGLIKSGSTMVGMGASNLVEKGVDYLGNRVGNVISSVQSGLNEPNIINPTNEPSHSISSMLGAERLHNGDIAIHRNMDSLAQEGIDSIVNNGDSYMYTYRAIVNPDVFNSNDTPITLTGIGQDTPNGLSEVDQNNLIQLLEAKRSNNVNFLRQNGVQDVTIDNVGRVQVHYNKLGLERMGISDVRTVNGGQRVVEIKKPYQPLTTYKTVTPNKVSNDTK